MSLPTGPLANDATETTLTKGKAPEPRQRSTTPPNLTEEEIVQSAKLRTQGTPNLQKQEQPQHEKPQIENVKPWRAGTNISADDLMELTIKKTLDLPLELELRLQFIRENKRKGITKKPSFSALQIEALDKYTRTELKKLGYDVD